MSWDIFSKSKIQYFLQKLKDKFVQKETGKGLSANDYTTTDKNKVSKIDTATTSISGNPISISGLKANQLAANPIITFEPIQAGSGTPSPNNVRAISGYDKIEVLSCGKNLFDESKLITGYFNDSDWIPTEAGWKGIAINANPGDKITVSGVVAQGGVYVVALKDIRDFNSGFIIITNSAFVNDTFTIPSGYHGIWIPMTNTSDKSAIQIEYGSTATTYEPYHKATSISESLGQTVYGATWYPRTGELRVTHKMVDMGNLNWHYQGSTWQRFYSDSVADMKNTVIDTEDGCLSEIFVTSRAPLGGSDAGDCAICLYNTIPYARWLQYNSDEAGFITAVTGKKLIYELSDSAKFTIQLTPHEISLLKDYAYVSTNGTNISLDYHNGEIASLADVSQLGETVNELGNKLALKSKAIYLSTSDIGTSFSPTATRLGTIYNILGSDVIKENIRGITIYDATLTPAALLFLGFYGADVYIAATQNTTLSDGFWVNILYLAE